MNDVKGGNVIMAVGHVREPKRKSVAARARPPIAPAGPAPARRKFTVRDYYRMAEAGILKPDERVELIDGVIFKMSPIGPRHFGNVATLNGLLARALADRAIVTCQGGIRVNNQSQPEPDVMVLKPSVDNYKTAIPRPADVFFLVEVMDTSVTKDRGVKLELYARARVAEVWLIDVNLERIEVYRKPRGKKFTERRDFVKGQSISPGAFPDVVLEVEAIL